MSAKMDISEFGEAKTVPFDETQSNNPDYGEGEDVNGSGEEDEEIASIDANSAFNGGEGENKEEDMEGFEGDAADDFDSSAAGTPKQRQKEEKFLSTFGEDFGKASLLEFSASEADMISVGGNSLARSQAEIDLDQLNDAYEGTQIEMKDLRNRLRRRSELVETFRMAYLRDVVAIKHCLTHALTAPERKIVLDEYAGRLPSLDLSKTLAVYAPTNAHARLRPCRECGGVLDVTINDSDHVAKLTAMIGKFQEREERLRLTIATQDAHTDTMTVKHNADARQHADEKRFLYAELKKVKANSEKVQADNVRINNLSTGYRDEIRNSKEQVARLLIKEAKLEKLEIETQELKASLQVVSSKAESGDNTAGILQQKINDEQVLNSQKAKVIAERDQTIAELQKQVEHGEVAVKKLKGLNEYLEKAYEDSQVKMVRLEGNMADCQEEARLYREETGVEMQTLQNIAAEATEEVRGLTKTIEDLTKREAGLQAALSAAEGLIIQKTLTVEAREKEIMAIAAEMEALTEELAALKVFVSDTVASKRTPSRARARAGGGGGGGRGKGSAAEQGADDDEGSLDGSLGDDQSWADGDAGDALAHGEQMQDLQLPQQPAAATLDMPAIKALRPEDLEEVDLAAYKLKLLMKQSGGQADGVVAGEQVDYSNMARPRSRPQPQPAPVEAAVDDEGSVGADSLSSSKGGGGASVEIRNDYSTSTIAPPTAQSAPKKKHQADRDSVKTKEVMLLPATPDAAAGELILRAEFMEAIQTTLGSNGSKKAMNAARTTMAVFGRFLTDCTECQWKGMLMAKRACDLLKRLQTFCAALLKCTAEGITPAQVGDIISELVPKIGSNYNFGFSEEWQADLKMNEQFSNLLDPSLDKERDLLFYKEPSALYGDSKEEYFDGTQESMGYLLAMEKLFDTSMQGLNKDLSKTIRDWMDAKDVQMNMGNTISKEKTAVKKEMQGKIDDINKELGMALGRFDAAKAFSKTLELKYETMNKRCTDLESFPEKLAVAMAELEVLRRVKIANEELIASLRLELKNKTDEWAASVADAAAKDERIKDMDIALTNSAEATVAFEQRYIFERQLKEKVQESLKEVLLAEKERKGSMCDKYTDCVALQRDADSQTEFLTPGMSVRTVIATGSGTIYKRRPFGVSLVDATEAQQQWDVAAHIKIQDGNRKVGAYASNFAVGTGTGTGTGKGTGKGTVIKLSQTVAPGLPISPQDELRAIRTPQTILRTEMTDILDDNVVLSRAGVTRDMVDETTGEIKQPVLMKVMSVGSTTSSQGLGPGPGPGPGPTTSVGHNERSSNSGSYGGAGSHAYDQETPTGVGLSNKLMLDSEWPAGATAQAPMSRGGSLPFSAGFDSGTGVDDDDFDIDNDSRSYYSASNDSFSLMSVANEAREAFSAYSAEPSSSAEGLPRSPIASGASTASNRSDRDAAAAAYKQGQGRGPQSQKMMVGVFPSSTYEGVSTVGGAEYRKMVEMQMQQQRRDRAASPIRATNSGGGSGGGGGHAQSARHSNGEINPVDMLELAKARLASERSDRSHAGRRRTGVGARVGAGRGGGDEWDTRPISPLKAAGLRNLDGASTGGSGGGNSRSSLKDPFALGSQSMVLLPSTGSLLPKYKGSLQPQPQQRDAHADDRDPAYMQFTMANILGGQGGRGANATVQATAESLSDLKRKFFRQGH